jgi:hypothetical protein
MHAKITFVSHQNLYHSVNLTKMCIDSFEKDWHSSTYTEYYIVDMTSHGYILQKRKKQINNMLSILFYIHHTTYYCLLVGMFGFMFFYCDFTVLRCSSFKNGDWAVCNCHTVVCVCCLFGVPFKWHVWALKWNDISTQLFATT